MKMTFVAALAVCGFCLTASANAAVIPAGAGQAQAQQVPGLTQAAVVVVRRGPGWHRPHRRPVCSTVVTRTRTPHGWVSRKVRRCR